MVHYFVIDYANTGDFYIVGVKGKDVDAIEAYLQSQSRDVRYLKSAERTKYKEGKETEVGKFVYCKFTSRCPKGLSPDKRGTVL